jgi:hypothetical protein
MLDEFSGLPACPQCAYWPMAFRKRRSWLPTSTSYKCAACGYEEEVIRSRSARDGTPKIMTNN